MERTGGKAAEKPGDAIEWGILGGSIGPRARLLVNALTTRSMVVSAPQGLPTGSLTVLALIAANPGSSQTALARKAGIAKSGLVNLVDQLEARGLAARDRSATDRRRNRLTVTPAGKEMMHLLFGVVDPEEAPVREALGPRDFATLLSLLDRALAALPARD